MRWFSIPFRKKFERMPKAKLEEPEPAYERVSFTEEQFYSYYYPFHCEFGGILPKIEIAYETWGKLNQRRDNAILLFTGVSGSSHAKSHEVCKRFIIKILHFKVGSILSTKTNYKALC